MRAVLLIHATDRPKAPAGCAPDMLLLDPAERGVESSARLIAECRAAAPRLPVFARIRPLAAGGAEDLASAMAGAPQGIWLRDAVGRAQAEQLASRLAVAEAEHGLQDGSTRIVASVESAAGALAAASLAAAGKRLVGIACDLGSIAQDVGCEIRSDPRLPEPLRSARGQVILAAAAAGLPAIDATAGISADLDAYAAEAAGSHRDGFTAKLALGPDQVEVLRRLAAQLIPPPPLGRWMENFVSGVATK